MDIGSRKKRILVIDDHELFLTTISKQLRLLGYDAKTTSDPHDGIELIKREVFDLVIVDMIMPQIGGRVAIEAIRHEDPDILILAVSGYYDIISDVLNEAAINGILPKPVNVEMLKNTLNDLFSKQTPPTHQGPGVQRVRQRLSN